MEVPDSHSPTLEESLPTPDDPADSLAWIRVHFPHGGRHLCNFNASQPGFFFINQVLLMFEGLHHLRLGRGVHRDRPDLLRNSCRNRCHPVRSSREEDWPDSHLLVRGNRKHLPLVYDALLLAAESFSYGSFLHLRGIRRAVGLRLAHPA